MTKEHEDYENWEVDKKVYVRDSKNVPWVGAHFACMNRQGKPTTWERGKTSHTTDNYTTWKFMSSVKD